MTEIGDNAFGACRSLANITIPDSVTSIGTSAFFGCGSITSITIPDSVTRIGVQAFSDCSSLTSITIPDGVTTISEFAFSRCSSLTSITIPDSVTSIGHSVFQWCDNLEKIEGKLASSDNRCLVIDGVLKAFAPAGLTEYTIPNSVTEIGDNAFDSCRSLRSITIPDSVTEIGGGIFRYCTNLTSVTIGNSVASIKSQPMFEDCDNLSSIYCKPTTPPALGNDSVFDDIPYPVIIYVPTASVEEYKSAAGWSEYADMIVWYNF